MAIQAGNRTYYNPTHGIEWRGSLLPYNTFYAIMSLCLFFVLALILWLCFRYFKFEVRKELNRQAELEKKYKKAMASKVQAQNGAPPGILKNLEHEKGNIEKREENSRKVAEEVDQKGEPRVKFSEDVVEETFAERLDSAPKQREIEENGLENCSKEESHL